MQHEGADGDGVLGIGDLQLGPIADRVSDFLVAGICG
jgi:hypothetical protein